jgi:hypothetical protein
VGSDELDCGQDWLRGGAIAAERVDKLIKALAKCYQMEHPLLDAIIGDVNDRLLANRACAVQPDVGRQPDRLRTVAAKNPVEIPGAY